MFLGAVAISLALLASVTAGVCHILGTLNRLEAKHLAFLQAHREDNVTLLRLIEQEQRWSERLRVAREDSDGLAEYVAETALCGIVRKISERETRYGRIRGERGLLGRLQPWDPADRKTDRTETPNDAGHR